MDQRMVRGLVSSCGQDGYLVQVLQYFVDVTSDDTEWVRLRDGFLRIFTLDFLLFLTPIGSCGAII